MRQVLEQVRNDRSSCERKGHVSNSNGSHGFTHYLLADSGGMPIKAWKDAEILAFFISKNRAHLRLQVFGGVWHYKLIPVMFLGPVKKI